MTMTLLVMIPVPADEAKQRLAKAKAEAREARKQAAGLLQFGGNNQRTLKKIAGYSALVEMNDRIAQGCSRALEDAASRAPDEPTPLEDLPDISIDEPVDEPITEERSISAMAEDEQPEPALMAADVDETGG